MSQNSIALSEPLKPEFVFEDYTWPAKEGIKPMAHQIATTKVCLQHKRAFVLNQMGLGKTINLLWVNDILLEARKIKRVLIAAPLSTLKSVWSKEIFFNMPGRTVQIAHGVKAVRLRALHSQAEYVIINHDGVRHILSELLSFPPDVLIIDELTACKSHNSARTKAIQQLALKARAVYGLTGEPTPNSPLEAYSQAKVVNPYHPLLQREFRYFTRYRDATMYRLGMYMWEPRPEAAQIVTTLLQPAVRYRREDCLDLPPTTYETLEVELTKEQADAYERMKKEAYIQFSAGAVSAGSAAIVLNKLLQISTGAVKLNDTTVQNIPCQPRLTELVQIFEQTPQKKLVVFAVYQATIKMLVEHLTKCGIMTRALYGAVSHTDRAKYIEEFQSGPVSVLVIQPQASAHGITLVAANTIVWFGLIASNELYQQANARIVRPGQTRNTHIIRLLSTPAEHHIAKLLDKKSKLSNEILDLFTRKSL